MTEVLSALKAAKERAELKELWLDGIEWLKLHEPDLSSWSPEDIIAFIARTGLPTPEEGTTLYETILNAIHQPHVKTEGQQL